MKKILSLVIVVYVLAACAKDHHPSKPQACDLPTVINKSYPKKQQLESLLEQYAGLGIPGTVISLYSPKHGYWAASSGYSNMESKTPMEICQLQYLQSISKTYLAVAVLKLYEEGKIDLDAPMTKYLPLSYSKYIDKAESISVRNLLNHTSGVPEYTNVPAYIKYLLEHPDHSFTSAEFLEYIKDEKQRFTPGTRFEYINTNYHLLALVADAITGDHARLIRQKVLVPAGLSNTYYRGDPGYLKYSSLPNSYIDINSNGTLQNVTAMQQVSVACSKGDDGMVTTPLEALKFLSALMQNKLLSPTSMSLMKTWVKNDAGQPAYGMGLFHSNFNGKIGYGHGGAGIGAGAALYYFPDEDQYVFLATNIGTLVDGPIVQKVHELEGKILEIVLADGNK